MMNRRVFTVVPAAASFVTPYSSGDVIGAVNQIPLALVNDGGAILLKNLTVLDAANQKAALDLIFFSGPPANSVGADNAAYALNDADLPLLLGRVSVTQASYVSSGTSNAESTSVNIDMILQGLAKSKSLYLLVVARGAATYGSATDLSIRVGVEQET